MLNRKLDILQDFSIPLSIIIIHSLLAFVGLTASRYVFKVLYENMVTKNIRYFNNVLIFGAGSSGILTYNALTSSVKSNIQVIGYIDEDRQKIGKVINGVPVFGPNVITAEFLRNKKVTEIIFSIQRTLNARASALSILHPPHISV